MVCSPDDEQPNPDGRVVAVVIPQSWTPDMILRLAQAMNRVVAAGEAGLKTIERVLSG